MRSPSRLASDESFVYAVAPSGTPRGNMVINLYSRHEKLVGVPRSMASSSSPPSGGVHSSHVFNFAHLAAKSQSETDSSCAIFFR